MPLMTMVTGSKIISFETTMNELRPPDPLDGPDFVVFEWEDETSQFDPHGYWVYGVECYMRKYRAKIPGKLMIQATEESDESIIHDWLSNNCERVTYVD